VKINKSILLIIVELLLISEMSKKVIALMSGTSVDGIDAALVNISEKNKELEVELLEFISLAYTKEFKKKILKAADYQKSRVKEIAELNIEIAEKSLQAVYKLIKKCNSAVVDIDLIASHGQTIYHNLKERPVTLQIGAAPFIAEGSGITTVYNFRMRDLAAGGEGAPLVPYVDYLLYQDQNKNRVLQNIGGISNYTYLPAGSDFTEVSGSDNGPGNMMIDYAVKILTDYQKDYDQDGKMAAQGRCSQKLLNYLMEHPFIKKEVPKSSGRIDFGEEFTKKIISKAEKLGLSDYDLLATITEFTARAIIDSYQRFLKAEIDEIIISGGGSYNNYLMQKIREYAGRVISPKVKVLTLEDLDQSSEAKEAVAFAVLGYQTMKGRTNNLPAATGAKRKVVLGDIVPGSDFYDYLDW
jgi:anhydro-N-acetylmuramic acid kinase